jgi:hypothetical protein
MRKLLNAFCSGRIHYRGKIATAGEALSLASSLAKSGFSGNCSTSSLSCARATSVFFSAEPLAPAKSLQTAASSGRDLELLDAYILVAMDSIEAKQKLLISWQTPDDLIRRT